MYTQKFKILRTSDLCLFFPSFSGWWIIGNFMIFLLHKSSKTHVEPILPPVGRKWQLLWFICHRHLLISVNLFVLTLALSSIQENDLKGLWLRPLKKAKNIFVGCENFDKRCWQSLLTFSGCLAKSTCINFTYMMNNIQFNVQLVVIDVQKNPKHNKYWCPKCGRNTSDRCGPMWRFSNRFCSIASCTLNVKTECKHFFEIECGRNCKGITELIFYHDFFSKLVILNGDKTILWSL
jgi:hypothetical protein